MTAGGELLHYPLIHPFSIAIHKHNAAAKFLALLPRTQFLLSSGDKSVNKAVR